MTLISDIYNRLPVFIQNAGISVYGLMWQRRRFGGAFQKYLAEFIGRENYSIVQWKQYQTSQLRKLLLHAFDTVPYYQSLFQGNGLTRVDIEIFELSDMNRIPELSKEDLRKFCKTELLSSVKEKGGSFYASSGSTGTPTSIVYSHGMHQRISALYEARCRKWAGVKYTDSRGMIGGRRVISDANAKPPYYRYNYSERQIYFSAYHINENTVGNYVFALQKYKPAYMVGYAMSLYILAKFIKGKSLKVPAMQAVLTSSEKLSDEMRQTISDVFQCKVFDAWSGMEWCGLISENEFGQLLLSPDSAIVEVIKPDGSHALPGETGELVCTGFLNFDQPLIRYRIGDTVRLAKDQTTKCGRAFPVIDEIIGRTEDTVITTDGRMMVRFHGIFVGLENVMKGQIIQEDYERFVVKVKTNGLTADEKKLIHNRMVSQVGDVSILVQEVEDIPPGPNGKFKAVISKVKNPVI